MAKSSRIIDALKTNTLYSFHVRAKNTMGVWSDLNTVGTRTTLKDITAPAVPGTITLLLLDGIFSLKWAKPSTLDLRGGGFKVYVFTANTPTSAVLIREVGYTADSTEIFVGEKSQDASITITAGTTYWWWVTTLDASGNESAKVATTPTSGHVHAAGTGLDHGVLTGLGDDDHPQYRLESADHSHQSTGAEAGQLDHGLALTHLAYADALHTGFEPAIAAGLTTQYWRGDKSWQILGTGAYFTVVPHNIDTILVNTDLGKIHIMDVSGGPRIFTLPTTDAGHVGYWIKLVRQGTANYLRVQAGGADVIWNSLPGGFIECDDTHDYSSVNLVQVAVGQWMTPEFGIWGSY